MNQQEPQQQDEREQREPKPTMKEDGELSEEALDLVTGGMGAVIAIQNYAALLDLLAGGG
jgi:hypothetical protein